MSVLIAIAHIGGSVYALIMLGIGLTFVGQWESEKVQERRLQAIALQLGVSVEQLNDDALSPRIMQLLADRSSAELLRNRLADLCGYIRTLWGWLGWLLQWVVLLAVIWFTVAEARSNAVLAWAAVAIAVFFWVASVTFSYACLLLTGRFPAEPRLSRKALIQSRSAAITSKALKGTEGR